MNIVLPPSIILNGAFNPRALIGLSGAPFVMTLVNYLKDQWRLPVTLAPLASVIISISLNLAMGMALGIDIGSSINAGLVTSFVASGYYELSKK